MNAEDKKRVVTAPQLGRLDSSSPVISIRLGSHEEMKWQWTHLPDVQSVVTG